MTRQGKQIVEVRKRGRLVLVADPGIVVVVGIVQVLGGTAAGRYREDLGLAREGARQPLDVPFPVASRRVGGGPRRGFWRRVR